MQGRGSVSIVRICPLPSLEYLGRGEKAPPPDIATLDSEELKNLEDPGLLELRSLPGAN